ncbi:phosphatidylserine/phosphatidylglycerophosphate/cardiolipin synthase family protein [Burkholderia stabilis]|uniref:Phosphatidylserine/phosphatidylglycerophosphate/ cardiolipin synthase family protein n=1 Tax=Burkholderia stabilis TaxID=95485 RepID=A0A4Q2A9E1_9BURK|nr:phosphatidylserine/phosphatidylglycerophosphate/cardiolipin synthase family protein [Burkholderia stabilis]RXV65441.1 phosphatidylserine/phosphatidylglycerophosphate/cardiolipin synthase family protein [Burkholderia stabilis]
MTATRRSLALIPACLLAVSLHGHAQCVDLIANLDDGQLMQSRIALVDHATPAEQIRVLAYIFEVDQTGGQMLHHLVAAARRGVPVKLLIDGIGPEPHFPFEDELIVALHEVAPGIELRIFHPRSHLVELAHRMHDKLFLVGDTAVIGSTSIWDPSFRNWLSERDLMVAGDASQDASALHAMRQHFDLFWNSSAAVRPEPEKFLDLASPYRVSQGYATLDPARIRYWREQLLAPLDGAAPTADPAAADTADGPGAPPASGADFDPGWTPIACDRLRYVHDWPDKRSPGTLQDMLHAFDTAQHEILIVTPYLILVPELRATLERKRREGVRVTVVSASLASTTQEFPAVGRAYADDLAGLVNAGIEVREYDDRKNRMMHAKLILIDGHRYYLGSFNFDPLSARSNTENGLWMDIPDDGIDPLRDSVAYYLHNSRPVSDANHRLAVDTVARCRAAGCGGAWRWVTMLIRDFL